MRLELGVMSTCQVSFGAVFGVAHCPHYRAGDAVLLALALGMCTQHMDTSILVSTLQFLLIKLLMVVDQISDLIHSVVFNPVIISSCNVPFVSPLFQNLT